MKEIEHKFLVDHNKWELIEKSTPQLIVQGYISKSEEKTVRIRIKGDKGFLTIKGKTVGISRNEYEYEIPVSDAEKILIELTDKRIRKLRYEITFRGRTWEVDVFEGHLTGLILAELEVEDEDERFDLPDWITSDVSNDKRYYNALLIDAENIPLIN
jgi:CYTH domain-containing protein